MQSTPRFLFKPIVQYGCKIMITDYFRQWQLAIQDFSNVLRFNPLNTEALLYRGSAYVKLHQWQDALIDFSSVIHLDPQNYVAYFKRGCLLRKAEPYLAIRDFSLSLLLESSEENILAYLYRGILYAQTKQCVLDFHDNYLNLLIQVHRINS